MSFRTSLTTQGVDQILSTDEQSSDWQALTEVLRRIHNGERDPKTLLPGLDEIEAAITQRVLAYLAGNPDIGIDPDAWRTLTDTKDDTDSGEDNLEAFIAAAVEAARGNAEAREALGPALDQLAADPYTAALAAALQNTSAGEYPATPLPDLDPDHAAVLEEIRRSLTQPQDD